MKFTAKHFILNTERVAIKINGEEFYLPKIVIDSEFVTSGVTGFDGIHDYVIDNIQTHPLTIFNELVDYITFNDSKMHIKDLKLSADTTTFIDKYLKNRVRLLIYILHNYTTNYADSSELEYFVADYYNKDPVYCEHDGYKILDAIRRTSDNMYNRIKKVFTGNSKFTQYCLKCDDSLSDVCLNLIILLAEDEPDFIPNLIRNYFHDVQIEETIPNIDHEEYAAFSKINIHRARTKNPLIKRHISDDENDDEAPKKELNIAEIDVNVEDII